MGIHLFNMTNACSADILRSILTPWFVGKILNDPRSSVPWNELSIKMLGRNQVLRN